MKRIIAAVLACALMLCACGGAQDDSQAQSGAPARESQQVTQSATKAKIAYRLASKEEGVEMLLSNTKYHDGFSQNDLDFRMHKTGATMDEYLAFAKEQVRDFTDEEATFISNQIARMEQRLDEEGYTLPPLDEIVFVKTTMAEEGGAEAYTHGTEIYFMDSVVRLATSELVGPKMQDHLDTLFWHELFHCLTRCNPDFRRDMYSLIDFTTEDEDFVQPASAFEYHISNPDVEHHNSHATFGIGGRDVECFCDLVTTRHFGPGVETFFDCYTTALIPTDGSDTYYTPEDAENFWQVFGKNTDYVIDPEECMADNFSYALAYGLEGQGGRGYKSPEIIEGIISYLKGE